MICDKLRKKLSTYLYQFTTKKYEFEYNSHTQHYFKCI